MRAFLMSLTLGLTGCLAAQAQGLDGLCFQGSGCTGPVPITGNSFFTCEANCVMENPVQVRGLDATLFDVTCRGDSGTSYDRLMILRTRTETGRTVFAIGANGPERLIPCP